MIRRAKKYDRIFGIILEKTSYKTILSFLLDNGQLMIRRAKKYDRIFGIILENS